MQTLRKCVFFREYPKFKGEVITTKYHMDYMSIAVPEELDYYERPKVWKLSGLPGLLFCLQIRNL